MYATFKCLHVLGIALLIGNVTATSVWKVFADRTRQPSVVAFAQQLVTLTDWTLTLGGVMLTLIGGYGMTWLSGLQLWQSGWLLNGQMLFVVSGMVWLFVLVPIQYQQATMARAFDSTGSISTLYWALGRRWIFWGLVATVPLVAAMVVMIVK